MLLSQTLSPIALRNGSRIAFRYLKYSITYKEFWETSNRYSYYLQKEIGHGLRVGLWMSNCPHFAYSFIALSNTKNCTVPLNPWASPEENLYKIKNSGVTVILCSGDHTRVLKEFLQQNGLGSINVIDMEGKRCAEYDASYTPPASHVPVEKDHILLFYTPGTTGKYKGCLFNHVAVSQAMTAIKGAHKASLTDVFYTQHHFSNPFNLMNFLLMPLAAAATVFISDETDYKNILQNLTEFRVTRMAPVANSLPEMLKFSEVEKIPVVTVKTMCFNGITLPKEITDLLKRTTKASVVTNYGMTEYLGTIALTPSEPPASAASKPGFIGPPLVGTKTRVVDDNNDEIDKKKPQKGQLLVMGQCLMDKYLELPEEQKLAVRGTWLFTGDMVELDKDGNIIFLERKADVVSLMDGRKIFPKEVEPTILQIPEILEVAYLGVPDRTKKIVPAVVIERKPQSNLTESQVREFLKTRLPANRAPVSIFFIDVMPRTVSGAINRARLRSQFAGV